jgi:hypothetical protein
MYEHEKNKLTTRPSAARKTTTMNAFIVTANAK